MVNFNDFLGYANHEQQIENAINAVVDAINNGDEYALVEVTDDFSPSEYEYIKMRVEELI